MYKTLHKKQGSVTVQLRFARSSVTFCAPRDTIYQEFEVIKEISGTIQAEIAPWGGSAGGGLQYELPKPILQLIKEGYIVPK